VSRTASLPAVSAPFEWADVDGVVRLEAPLGNARAVFSTRLGGVSEGPYESLNLGVLTDDEEDRVRHNRGLLAQALGRERGSVAMGHQVHGAELQVRDRVTPEDGLAKVDAQLTTSPDVTPLVLVADCAPLILAAPGAVAAVHCGWRGAAAGIVTRAVEQLRELGGGPVTAAIGPGIGPCCYEVGPDVLGHFTVPGPMLDIPSLIATELSELDVDVHTAGICVSCNAELFFSHRRDGGVTGRQAGLAWLGS
jgi:polyphenol oxidase